MEQEKRNCITDPLQSDQQMQFLFISCSLFNLLQFLTFYSSNCKALLNLFAQQQIDHYCRQCGDHHTGSDNSPVRRMFAYEGHDSYRKCLILGTVYECVSKYIRRYMQLLRSLLAEI